HQLQQAGEAVRLAGIVDSRVERADSVAREYGARAFGSVEQMISTFNEIEAASVAVSTPEHVRIGRILIEAGGGVLVEKPLAATLEEVDELMGLATGRVAQAGHVERFNPAVRATAQIITQPMFFEVHRLSMFTPRSLDVDVVLDLMIHDLDVVLSFVNS